MNNDNETIETIETLWNNTEAMLVGVGDDYAETIDRDQAVDDDGKAVFESYVFEIGDGYDEAPHAWKFTASEVEEFARTW